MMVSYGVLLPSSMFNDIMLKLRIYTIEIGQYHNPQPLFFWKAKLLPMHNWV